MNKSALLVWTLLLGSAASAQSNVLVSHAANGGPANGASSLPSLTPDGRYVAYSSDATNLVAGDTNLLADLFVFDSVAQTTERINVATSGAQANGGGSFGNPPSLTPDGRYVLFNSTATNLVAGDTNGVMDVFVRDRVAGTTERVSLGTGGVQPDSNSVSFRSSISADGRYVVFLSDAGNLGAGTFAVYQVYLRDRVAGTTTILSRSSTGVVALENSSGPSITPDGRFVTFSSIASNLVTGDTNNRNDVFLRDRLAGTTERVSISLDEAQANSDSNYSSLSDDGRYVVFQSDASNLVPNGTGTVQVYLRDRQGLTTQRMSFTPAGQAPSQECALPMMSGDGRFVAFNSLASDIVSGDTNGLSDIFVRDRLLGTMTRASVGAAGIEGNGQSFGPAAVNSAGDVAFLTQATNLVPNDTNGLGDIVARYAPPPPSNDECSTPQPIFGTGTFAVDSLNATTGSEGQSNSGCGAGIVRDVWFLWTASFSGTAEISTCQQSNYDTKIAVHAGSTCPTGLALACNDNGCGLRSRLCLPVLAGSAYLIQIGATGSSGSGVLGTFTIAQSAASASGCSALDHGSTSTALGLASDGWTGWVQRFGNASGTTTVTAVSTAWGTATAPASSPVNGSAAKVAIWDDPNEDGNPNDAVLLATADAFVVGSGTDAFQTIAFAAPVPVAGYFFVGAAVAHAANVYPIPLDQPPTCDGFGRVWYTACAAPCTLDFSTFAQNFTSLNGEGEQWGQVLVRPVCAGNISFCSPAQAGVIGCPCANQGQPGRGCENSDATGGGLLGSSGSANTAADTLVLTTSGQKASSVSIVLQGSLSNGTGAVFAQGVRCTAGALRRLYTKSAVGGSISAPGAGDPSVSAQSATLGDPLSAGSARYYQVYYRDPNVLGGCPASSTFNITQGLIVTWI